MSNMDNDTHKASGSKKQPLSGRVGSAARDELPKFYYVNVVWGADYVDLFTRYSLPTLLSPGNLPCLPNRLVSEFLMVTPEEDAERIRASAIFDRLSELIKVVFIPIAITTEHKYDLMTHGHRLAVDYVARRGYCIFLSPDALLSDGGLKRLFELATAGRRVVGVFGARVNEEAVGEELCSSCHYRQGEPLCLEPRQLVELMTRHLHSDLRHHYVDSAYFPEKPYACIWPAPSGKGMLVRSLNLHPLLFDCQLVPEGENIAHLTIDWYLIPRFVTDWNDFYVEKDSENLCIIELSPSTLRAKPAKLGSPDAGALSLWLLRGRYALMNRASFLFPIMFHTRSLDKAWDELVRRTGEFALEVADPNGAARESTLLGHALLTRSAVVAQQVHEGNRTEVNSKLRSVVAESADNRPGHRDSRFRTAPLEGIPFFHGFCVWSERYIDYLCRFALPSLLSPRNLPTLPNNDVSTFVIVTTPEDEKRLRAREIFRLLARFINVEFAYLPATGGPLPTANDIADKYN